MTHTLDTQIPAARPLRRDLTAVAVLAFIVASMAPLMVNAGVNTTAIATTGLTGLPLVYVVVGVVLVLFIPGYLAATRRLSGSPGAFYAIAARGFSRSVALGAGFIALIAYGALFVGLFGVWGATVAPQLSTLTGLPLHPWHVMVAAWVVVLICGLLRVELTGWVVTVLLAAEIAFVVVADLVMFAHPFGGRPQWHSWDVSQVTAGTNGGFGAAFCICFLAIIGIEGGAVLHTESRQGYRTVRRGTTAAAVVIVALYLVSSWAMAWSAGDSHLVARAGSEQTGLLFNLAGPYLGPVITDAGTVLLDTSIFIGMLGFSTFWARYAYAMSREGLLPSGLSRTRPKAGVPAGAIFTLMGLALAVIGLWSLMHWDPLVTLFYWGGTFGGFGIMVLFAITAVSVVGYYARRPHRRRADSIWVRLVLPLLAAVTLIVAVVLAVSNYDVMLGVSSSDPLRWILPGVFAATLIVCAIVGLVLRATRPDAYSRIGLGDDADTGIDERADLDDEHDGAAAGGQVTA